jgi:hypothetical protein
VTNKLYREFNEVLEEVFLEMEKVPFEKSSVTSDHREEAVRRYKEGLKAAAIRTGYGLADFYFAWRVARVAMYEYRQSRVCLLDMGQEEAIAYFYDIPSWNMVKAMMDIFTE